MTQETNNKTLSIRLPMRKIDELRQSAAHQTMATGVAVNYIDLIRQAIDEKYFSNEVQK